MGQDTGGSLGLESGMDLVPYQTHDPDAAAALLRAVAREASCPLCGDIRRSHGLRGIVTYWVCPACDAPAGPPAADVAFL